MRCSKKIFLELVPQETYSVGLNLSHCFITLEMKFKAGCRNKVSSRVEFCGHCSCVTSLSANVSVPGPPPEYFTLPFAPEFLPREREPQ